MFAAASRVVAMAEDALGALCSSVTPLDIGDGNPQEGTNLRLYRHLHSHCCITYRNGGHLCEESPEKCELMRFLLETSFFLSAAAAAVDPLSKGSFFWYKEDSLVSAAKVQPYQCAACS